MQTATLTLRLILVIHVRYRQSSHGVFMFESLQARLTYLFAAFVLLVVVSVGAMIWRSETQRQDAVLINLAG